MTGRNHVKFELLSALTKAEQLYLDMEDLCNIVDLPENFSSLNGSEKLNVSQVRIAAKNLVDKIKKLENLYEA